MLLRSLRQGQREDGLGPLRRRLEGDRPLDVPAGPGGRLGEQQLSGGIWHGDDLLATGHDKKIIYRLRVPKEGKVVEVIEAVPSPFPGRGIAVDPKTGGLVGIDRGKRLVVFAKYESR